MILVVAILACLVLFAWACDVFFASRARRRDIARRVNRLMYERRFAER